jgi:hypothetical protein
MFWTCAARFGCALTTVKGVTIYFQEHKLPKGVRIFETKTGSILLDIFWLGCDKNRASDITWEVRQPEKIGILERQKQGLEERGERR